jgi:hypothetical protein
MPVDLAQQTCGDLVVSLFPSLVVHGLAVISFEQFLCRELLFSIDAFFKVSIKQLGVWRCFGRSDLRQKPPGS